MEKNDYVVPLDDIGDHIGDSLQAQYIIDYLIETLIAKTGIIENEYVDKDYLIDYSGFFARSFEKIERFTKRIHFFSNFFSQKDFEQSITLFQNNIQDAKPQYDLINDLKRSYLGYVVIKPVEYSMGQPLIGRTLLKPPSKPVTDSFDTRECIIRKNSANLYGIPLNVDALPFQVQDSAVAACATVSLWMANSKINELFGTQEFSPIEITSRATEFIESGRNFPSTGLTIKQMVNFFKGIGLDYDTINIDYLVKILNDDNYSENKKNLIEEYLKDVIPDAVKAISRTGIPIVASISLIKKDHNLIEDHEHHAVVICGFRQNENGQITKLYVHDDQIGPYCRVKDASPKGKFLKWQNEWVTREGYSEVTLDKLLIPIYPKIRITFDIIYSYCRKLRKDNPGLNFDLYLTTVQDYKKMLLRLPFRDKVSKLKESMPRFIWVISAYKGESLVREWLIDATSHHMRIFNEIDYT